MGESQPRIQGKTKDRSRPSMQTKSQTDTPVNTGTDDVDAVKPKKLTLKREAIRNLNDELLTSQGHSLWTCDTAPAAEK
jgi:hypothetical protein